MIGTDSSLVDVAYVVCTALDAAGITAVLTGGSAATFYAPHAYQSDDLDFIITFRGEGGGHKVLENLGYELTSGSYQHPSSRYPIEFPRGPLSIGDEIVESWSTHRRGHEVLHVLSPTDSCRDRLAAFLYWNDFAGLAQAVFVAQAHPKLVDLDLVRGWCEREGVMEKFLLFEQRLAPAP